MLNQFGPLIRRVRRRQGQSRTAPSPTRYAVLLPPQGTNRVFVKAYKHNSRLEFERGWALYEAGERSGAFRAPRPLELIEPHHLIVWDFQDGLVESRDFLVSDLLRAPTDPSKRIEFFLAVGRALAGVHCALRTLPAPTRYQPMHSIRSPFPALNRHAEQELARSPGTPLHWDFACGNLFVHPGDGRIDSVFVLDPMPNFYIMPEYFGAVGMGSDVHSSPYVDAGQLVFSFRSHPRFAGWVAAEQDAYLEAFLSGYHGTGGDVLDAAAVLACAGEITLMYQDFLDRSLGRWSLTDWLDRRFRLWSAEQLFNDAAARLAPPL